MKIKDTEAWVVQMKLSEPYAIAYETIDQANNVFIRIRTYDGIVGYGCAAPDPGVTADQERMLREIGLVIVIYTAAVGIIGAPWLGPERMGGVFAGGLVTYLNYVALRGIVTRLTSGKARPRQFTVNLILKMLVLAAVVGVLIALKLVEAIGFIIGLMSLMAGIFIVYLRWQFFRPPKGAD